MSYDDLDGSKVMLPLDYRRHEPRREDGRKARLALPEVFVAVVALGVSFVLSGVVDERSIVLLIGYAVCALAVFAGTIGAIVSVFASRGRGKAFVIFAMMICLDVGVAYFICVWLGRLLDFGG